MVNQGLSEGSRKNPPLKFRCQPRVVEAQTDQVLNKFAARFRLNISEHEDIDRPKFMKTLERLVPFMGENTRQSFIKLHPSL
jgi:hypothetical protein